MTEPAPRPEGAEREPAPRPERASEERQRPPSPDRRVTVVVPAYNEAARISSALDRLVADAPALGILELIVVDDGSTDTTAQLVAARITEISQASDASPAIRLIQLSKNRGKGAAIRAGVAEARGDYVLFLDADLSAPPTAIPRAIAAIEAGADVAIGTRVAPGADARRTQPLARQLSGRIFGLLQRVIVGLPYADTQCPFKLFTRQAAEQVYPRVQTSGWAFDVELLAQARRLGLAIQEFPVDWQHVNGSHIHASPVTALRVIRELILIRVRLGRTG